MIKNRYKVTTMNSITISWLMKTVRPYSNNPNKAFQNMLGDKFDNLTESKIYFVESTSSSRIMTNEYDVPYSIREGIADIDECILIGRFVSYFNFISLRVSFTASIICFMNASSPICRISS